MKRSLILLLVALSSLAFARCCITVGITPVNGTNTYQLTAYLTEVRTVKGALSSTVFTVYKTVVENITVNGTSTVVNTITAKASAQGYGPFRVGTPVTVYRTATITATLVTNSTTFTGSKTVDGSVTVANRGYCDRYSFTVPLTLSGASVSANITVTGVSGVSLKFPPVSPFHFIPGVALLAPIVASLAKKLRRK